MRETRKEGEEKKRINDNMAVNILGPDPLILSIILRIRVEDCHRHRLSLSPLAHHNYSLHYECSRPRTPHHCHHCHHCRVLLQ